MLKVGLTGGIGSGKSTVSKMLHDKGAVIIDADLIAREVVEPGQAALAELAEEFGSDIVLDDGSLNRALLAQRAFVDEQHTQKLNAITHPHIKRRTRELFASAPEDAIVVHDVALLIEMGLDKNVDLVVVVDVPADIRVQRLIEHRGLTEGDARARIARQISDEERKAAADIVIDNSGTVEQLAIQVEELWAELQWRLADV